MYEKNPLLIVGTEEKSSQLANVDIAGAIYDDLINRNISSAQNIAAIVKKIDRYRSRIETIQQTENSKFVITPEEYERAKAEAEVDINRAAEKLGKYIEYVNTITKEYYESKHFDDSYRISAPATYDGIGLKNILISMVLYGVAVAAAGCALMFIYQCIAVYIPFDVLTSKQRNDRKNDKNTDEKDDSK